jgi:hypothetical protein
MGICGPDFISIQSVLDCNFDHCKVQHHTIGANEFWILWFPLRTGYERQREQIEIGRIKNVQCSLRLTKET